MSIAALDKITLVGHQASKSDVLDGLQQLGCLHLIPLSPEGRATGAAGPSKPDRPPLAKRDNPCSSNLAAVS